MEPTAHDTCVHAHTTYRRPHDTTAQTDGQTPPLPAMLLLPAARLRFDLGPVDVVHPLLVVLGLGDGLTPSPSSAVVCRTEALSYYSSCNLPNYEYGNLDETGVSKAVSAGEKRVSDAKDVSVNAYSDTAI